MTETGGALGQLAASLTGLLVRAAAALTLLVIGWNVFKILLAGGNDRAAATAVKTILIVVVAVAMLENLPAVGALCLGVGRTIAGAVLEAVQGAL